MRSQGKSQAEIDSYLAAKYPSYKKPVQKVLTPDTYTPNNKLEDALGGTTKEAPSNPGYDVPEGYD